MRTATLTPRRHRGQILFITLLALVLLASMVFFVFNTGEQVNRRMSMQNAADSAAISGATQMARSMNIVAMNNVAQSRLIAMAAILDSLPLASQLTFEELDAIIKGLEAQLQDPRLTSDPRLKIVLDGINSMLNDRAVATGDFWHPGLRLQRDRIAPLHSALNLSGFDVRSLTYWDLGGGGATPDGELWKANLALQDFSTATVETAGVNAQAAATQFGQSCIWRDPQGQTNVNIASSFVVPILPILPAKDGTFLSFQSPVMNGTPPELVKGSALEFAHRGPYDQLFHWRREVWDSSWARPPVYQQVSPPTWVPGTRGAPIGGAGRPGLSPPPPGGAGGYWQDHVRTISPGIPGMQKGWNPYGVYDWALTVVTDYRRDGEYYPSSGTAWYCGQNVPDLPANLFPGGTASEASNFLKRTQKLSKAKLDYFWGNRTVQTIHHPVWIASYDAAKTAAQQNVAQVKYTWLWIIRIRSSVQWDTPAYMQDPKTYYPKPNARDYDPYSCPVQRGWLDPGDPANVAQFGAAKQVANGVWMTDWTYQVEWDSDIGIAQPPPPPAPVPGVPATPPVLHDVYVRDFFVFFGVDVGNEDAIRNPGNWPAGVEPPKPQLLDLAKAEYRTDGPDFYNNGSGSRYYMNYLGVARETAQANLWPGRFRTINPYGSVLSLAEAQVFNNQSWDLWTQDWQARLKPVEDYPYWVTNRMNAAASDLAAVQQYVNADDLTEIREMLSKYPVSLVEKVSTK
ncbi:MAG: Tad domain-containing protein [Phycisphaerae bacterium]|nr:Tad domain-containing protein [Phycisphaerae bacterium]